MRATKKEDQAANLALKTVSNSCDSLHSQSDSVNPHAETIALLSETVWLLTGIYNLQIEQLSTLQDIKRRMP